MKRRSKKKSSRVYKKRNDGTSDFELGLALSDDYANSEALSRLDILENDKKTLKDELDKLRAKEDCCEERDALKKDIDKKNNALKELIEQIKNLQTDNEKLKKEIDEKNKIIEEISKFKECDSTQINDLKKLITELTRIIAEKDGIIAEKDGIIDEKDRKINEKDRKINELEQDKIELNLWIENLKNNLKEICDKLNRIYNIYIENGNTDSFKSDIRDLINNNCETEVPRDRRSIPRPSDPPPPPQTSSRFLNPTESSKTTKTGGGKMGRSSDGLKKKRSKKVLKNSPRRSRKLKRSSKKKRN